MTSVKKADIIISGEGKFDSQSFGGKVISGIKKYNPKRLVIICGISEVDQNDVYPIVPKYATVEESLNNPKESLEKLLKKIPKKYHSIVNHVMVLHGRYVCSALRPKCEMCPVAQFCPYTGKRTDCKKS